MLERVYNGIRFADFLLMFGICMNSCFFSGLIYPKSSLVSI